MFVNTFWSLVPPIVAIGLALLTNRLCYDHLPQADMNAFRLAVHEAILEERN